MYLRRHRRLVGRASTLAATSGWLGPTAMCVAMTLATAPVSHKTPYSLVAARSVPIINGTGSFSVSKEISIGWPTTIIQAIPFQLQVILSNFLLMTDG